jgi:zona occludens toxin
MLIFHEGLPRSGKSYEAMRAWILPALKSGREVFANLEGMNHERIAQVENLPLERVRELLHQIAWEDTTKIHQIATKDCLIVLDEGQDFWPVKGQISTEHTTFFTKHGHKGQDILVMGQDYRDCHAIIKRRIQRRLRFTKTSSLGSENRYIWVAYEAKGEEKFIKVGQGTETYDQRYFGMYQSHDPGTENKGNLKDKRFTLWSHPAFKYGLPVFIVALIWGLNAIWNVFHGGLMPDQKKPVSVSAVPSSSVSAVPSAAVSVPLPSSVSLPSSVAQAPAVASATMAGATPAQAEKSLVVDDDYIDQLSRLYRPRVSGVMSSGSRVTGLVEFLDAGYRAIERLNVAQIEDFGWKVTEKNSILTLRKKEKTLRFTSWPVEPFGSMGDNVAKSPEVKGERERSRDYGGGGSVVLGSSPVVPSVPFQNSGGVSPMGGGAKHKPMAGV